MTITATIDADAINARLGRRVRSLMFGKLTQVELAEKIGTTQSALSRRIHGDVDFRPHELSIVARALGTTVDALLAEGGPSDYKAMGIRPVVKLSDRPRRRSDSRGPGSRAA